MTIEKATIYVCPACGARLNPAVTVCQYCHSPVSFTAAEKGGPQTRNRSTAFEHGGRRHYGISGAVSVVTASLFLFVVMAVQYFLQFTYWYTPAVEEFYFAFVPFCYFYLAFIRGSHFLTLTVLLVLGRLAGDITLAALSGREWPVEGFFISLIAWFAGSLVNYIFNRILQGSAFRLHRTRQVVYFSLLTACISVYTLQNRAANRPAEYLPPEKKYPGIRVTHQFIQSDQTVYILLKVANQSEQVLSCIELDIVLQNGSETGGQGSDKIGCYNSDFLLYPGQTAGSYRSFSVYSYSAGFIPAYSKTVAVYIKRIAAFKGGPESAKDIAWQSGLKYKGRHIPVKTELVLSKITGTVEYKDESHKKDEQLVETYHGLLVTNTGPRTIRHLAFEAYFASLHGEGRNESCYVPVVRSYELPDLLPGEQRKVYFSCRADKALNVHNGQLKPFSLLLESVELE